MKALSDFPAKIAAFGPVFSPEVLAETTRLYESHANDKQTEGVRIHSDIAYGPHLRHRLDVFNLEGDMRRPVLVFIHGGGFVSGDKSISDVFYRNIGLWFARRGVVTITANYRLAPDFRWPAGAEDVASVVRWITDRVSEFGGDPGKLFLFGHSAGACHVAGYLFDPELRHATGTTVLGATLVSGVYRAFGENVKAATHLYFGDDADARHANAPLSRASRNEFPVFIAVAEFDPSWIAIHSLELAEALMLLQGSCPQLAWFKGHNHVSTVYSFGSGQTEIGDSILGFMQDILNDT